MPLPHIDSFRQARHYNRGRLKPLRLLVVHATQGGESSSSAEAVQAMFAKGDRVASAHVTIDPDTVAGSVHPTDTAFAAKSANADGYHVELTGRSEQTAEQWDDANSRLIIDRAARHFAEASKAFGVPLVWLTVDQVRGGRAKGVTDHATISQAFPSTGHWDPGPNFPRSRFMALARQYAGELPAPLRRQEDPMLFRAEGEADVYFTKDGKSVHILEDKTVAAMVKAGIPYAENIAPEDRAVLLKAYPV